MLQHQTNTDHPAEPVDYRTLPGPDTSTKREAVHVPDPRYQHMLREAQTLSWPEAFTDDLYLHDRRILEAHAEESMLWMLRNHGTHLFPIECESPGQAHYAREVIRYWSGEHKLNVADSDIDRARYFVVQNSGLTQLTASKAVASITVDPLWGESLRP